MRRIIYIAIYMIVQYTANNYRSFVVGEDVIDIIIWHSQELLESNLDIIYPNILWHDWKQSRDELFRLDNFFFLSIEIRKFIFYHVMSSTKTT